jgi:ElaA protein
VIVRVVPFAELSTTTLYALLMLRCDVFVVEQRCPYPELDGRDLEPGARHVWMAVDQDGPPVAYLRILDEPDGSARIGRVCTAADHRRRGLAAALVRHALDHVGPARRCVLDAQETVVDLYRGLGFSITGPLFIEDGIPHVPMGTAPTAPSSTAPTAPSSTAPTAPSSTAPSSTAPTAERLPVQ